MASAKRRRAYIGNLRPRPNLADNLHADLFIPHCLSVKNYPGGDGISVRQPKFSSRNGGGSGNNTARASSAYALVEFVDVDYAVQVLDGVQFDGRTLRVSREKTNNFGGSRGGGFGSSRWAGDDGGGRGQRRDSNKQPSKGRAGDNPSSDDVTNVPAGTDGQGSLLANWEADGLTREEAAAKEIGSAVSAEIQESSDEVTAAIACTAAMTLLSSVDAFGLEGEPDAIAEGAERNQSEGDKVNTNDMTNGDFLSRCKLPLADLMTEYGEQDVDWKKQQPPTEQPQDTPKSDKDLTNDDFQSRCKMPLSELMAEYGEQDLDWKKDQKPASTQTNTNRKPTEAKNKSKSHRNEQSNDKDSNGMLAPFGKAPIHVELVSFGYKYGAPSHSKRGFTYAQPLPPLDIRDLDRAPGHVAKFNGLSYLVKRALLNPSKAKDDDDCEENEAEEDTGAKEQSPMRQRANDIADEVIKMLVESIDEGGHGAISPLTMTISVGSEYGRHRSVVLVEHLAVVLRARLRRNDGRRFNETGDAVTGATNGIVQQPVSVGTRHMHVEARHQDEEAFGEDLKREFRRAEKAKRRQEREDELGWDDGSW